MDNGEHGGRGEESERRGRESEEGRRETYRKRGVSSQLRPPEARSRFHTSVQKYLREVEECQLLFAPRQEASPPLLSADERSGGKEEGNEVKKTHHQCPAAIPSKSLTMTPNPHPAANPPPPVAPEPLRAQEKRQRA